MNLVRRRGRSPRGPPGPPGPPPAGPPMGDAGGAPPGSGSGCVVTIVALSSPDSLNWLLLERQIVGIGDLPVHHGVAPAAGRHAGTRGPVEKLHILRYDLSGVAL